MKVILVEPRNDHNSISDDISGVCLGLMASDGDTQILSGNNLFWYVGRNVMANEFRIIKSYSLEDLRDESIPNATATQQNFFDKILNAKKVEFVYEK